MDAFSSAPSLSSLEFIADSTLRADQLVERVDLRGDTTRRDVARDVDVQADLTRRVFSVANLALSLAGARRSIGG